MTRENAKALLPIIQAWADGAVVEIMEFGVWSQAAASVHFDMNPSCYRIKPTPKLRPWKPEEVPLGAWVKWFSDNGAVERHVITGHGACSVYFGSSASGFADMLKYHAYSIDGGKTWLPCGVEETQ